jgi:hypothetical protein
LLSHCRPLWFLPFVFPQSLLRDCLLHVSDVSEFDLARILDFALRLPTEAVSAAVTAASASAKSASSSSKSASSASSSSSSSSDALASFRLLAGARAHVTAAAAELVALVVSAPRNDAFLLQALAALPAARVAVCVGVGGGKCWSGWCAGLWVSCGWVGGVEGVVGVLSWRNVNE